MRTCVPDGSRLPDPPLAGLGDPRLVLWRQRGLWVSLFLVAMYAAGVVTLWRSLGMPWTPLRNIVDAPPLPVLALTLPAPNLLLSLAGVHLLCRPSRTGRAAAMATTALAVLCAVGHTYIGPAADQVHAGYLVYAAAGLVGDVFAVLLVNTTRSRRWVEAVALSAIALSAGMIAAKGMWDAGPLTWHLQMGYTDAMWGVGALWTSGAAPIVGAFALLWVLATEPRE